MRGNSAPRQAARYAIAAVMAAAAASAAGCGGSGTAAPAVPSIGGSAHSSGGTGASRAAALHAAAQCIRQHGVPGYSDPVLSSNGQVYTDSRPLEDAGRTVLSAINQSCGALLTQADLNPMDEPPAPPQLVQAGVRTAECLRANGLPHMQDPTAQTSYTPGHGFGMTASEVPPGGKSSPIWQHAAQVCHAQINAEIQASTLGSLSDDG
jgi:hypothetical protein